MKAEEKAEEEEAEEDEAEEQEEEEEKMKAEEEKEEEEAEEQARTSQTPFSEVRELRRAPAIEERLRSCSERKRSSIADAARLSCACEKGVRVKRSF